MRKNLCFILDELINNVNALIRLGKGDLGRLEYIKQTIENNKQLYTSDRNYLYSLIEKHLGENQKIEEDLSDVLEVQELKEIPPSNITETKISETKIDNEKPKKKKRSKKRKIGIGIGVIVLVYFMSMFFHLPYNGENNNTSSNNYSILSKLTVEELQDKVISWEYDDILRNDKNFVGEIIHFSGTVTQSFESSKINEYDLMVKYSCKPWPATLDCNFFYVDYSGTRLLKDDQVDVYGVFTNLEELDMVMGGKELTPRIHAIKLTCTNC
jgi:hypothetical protein